jgi:hypothetical protein
VYWIIAIVGGLVFLAALPFLLTFPVACWETRYVWPYEPLREATPGATAGPATGDPSNPYQSPAGVSSDPPPPLTSEARFWNESAHALGMRYVGVLRHATSSLIKVRYDFWLSPGREFLAIVGGGKVASIPVNSIFLWSVLGDGRILTTINADSAADPDLTDMTQEMLFPGEGFELLSRRHWARLTASAAPPQLFSGENPLRDLLGIRQLKYARLEELGYCRFLDSERNQYRLTLRGAFWYALLSVARGYRRQFSPDKAPAMPAM